MVLIFESVRLKIGYPVFSLIRFLLCVIPLCFFSWNPVLDAGLKTYRHDKTKNKYFKRGILKKTF